MTNLAAGNVDPASDPLRKVSIVITTRNRNNLFKDCVASLAADVGKGAELIVVNDASDEPYSYDGLPPRTRVIEHGRRKLLSESRNDGWKASTRDFIFFIDDDNFVRNGATEALAATLENSNTGVASPIILDPEGKIWFAGGAMSSRSGISVFKGRTSNPQALVGKLLRTMTFHNSFMVKRSVLEVVGGFDAADFPMYLSEADFAERMHGRGFLAVVNPHAVVVHRIKVGGAEGALRNAHITEPIRAYLVAKNRILYMRRHRSPGNFLVFLFLFQPIIAATHLVLMTTVGRSKQSLLLAYVHGLIDALKGRGRPVEDLFDSWRR